ncbi:glycosyltransferase family 9 protein [Ramlibacter alkalitolerans]|uniref:Glycosyltransferase family 9 protein n=1 Tax=Ramlibacter alkalitolerans TaxID=2039631 RepID=A0ABS1JL26_9BURK|nr:glycosyltransferase family 9 protein [Ramlibacter alkalitolerans]
MHSLLVIVTRQIGDVLLTTPLIHAARHRWPDAAIDVLGFEGTLEMLRGNPDVRELIATPPRLGFAGGLRLMRRLWRRYDLALVAEASDRAHLMGAVASRHRAGLVPPAGGSSGLKKRLLDHAVVVAGDLGEVHVVQEKLALLAPWQELAPPARLVAPPSQPLPAPLARQLAPGYVVVHTPSMWPYKQWPLEHFRTLLGLLAAAGRQVVLTGGPSAGDRAAIGAMQGAAPAPLLVDAGLLDFGQLAGLLRGAALYIGPDTSVSHLAAACEVPVLAIFGPTHPQRWAPWPALPREQVVHWQRRASVQSVGQVTLMQAELPCAPCGKAGCEDHRMSGTECLPAIRPERVAQEALRILAHSRHPRAGGDPEHARSA